MKEKKTSVRMTAQEKKDWDELYRYVKDIFGYDDNQALPKFAVMRLKGLIKGKFYANKSTTDMANYTYRDILLTFKFCSMSIKKALRTKEFDTEQSKWNYILAIVSNNINSIYTLQRTNKKSEEKLVNLDINFKPTNNYIRKTKEGNKNLEDLW